MPKSKPKSYKVKLNDKPKSKPIIFAGVRRKPTKDLQKRIDKFLKNTPPNPQPNNPFMRYHEGKWVDYSPSALAKRLKDERDKALKPLKPLADLSAKIQKTNERLIAPIKKLRKDIDAVSLLTGKPIEYKSVLNPMFNPFAFAYKLKPNATLLGSVKIPKVKPEGSKRRAITGTGLTSYMERHNLSNPVDIAKTYLTKEGKDYKVTGFNNLRFLCEQMNVTAEEALLYICEGMTDTKSRWRKHRLDKEFWRGSQSVVNLVKHFKEQVGISKKDKNKLSYTVKMLWQSEYCKDLFKEYGVVLPDYTQFSKWFKKMRHHVEVLKLDQPQSNEI